MTGTGAYYYIVWGIWLRHHLNYKQNEYELVWLNFWTVPDVVRRCSVAVEASKSGKKEL
jgi:dihydroceramidase